MISVILTAYKESDTIGKAIESILDNNYSGYDGAIQLIQISPDKETLKNGKEAADRYSSPDNIEFVQLKDPGKGKPYALNMGLKEVKGEIVIFTDGDIYFDNGAVGELLKLFEDRPEVGGVTGRPVSIDSKDNMMGYYGHLFADANHYRRMVDLADANQEKSKFFVRKHKFFPMSGYIMAVRREVFDFRLPEDTLVDDAYISYRIYNKGFEIEYAPEARAFIKYPKSLSDYFKQKVRSTGGYIQLWKYGIVKEETKSRSPWHELELIWFPFKYASTPLEYLWSLLLLPVRLWLWARILFDQKILKKDFEKTWVRVESTK